MDAIKPVLIILLDNAVLQPREWRENTKKNEFLAELNYLKNNFE